MKNISIPGQIDWTDQSEFVLITLTNIIWSKTIQILDCVRTSKNIHTQKLWLRGGIKSCSSEFYSGSPKSSCICRPRAAWVFDNILICFLVAIITSLVRGISSDSRSSTCCSAWLRCCIRRFKSTITCCEMQQAFVQLFKNSLTIVLKALNLE